MYNITVIYTIHEECGKCNSLELFKIIEKIAPQIIFEELCLTNYEKTYELNTLTGVESTVIKYYLLENDISHIPVDTFPRPRNFDEDMYRLYDKITNSVRIRETHELRNLIEQNERVKSHYGFSFLNSDENDQYFREVDRLKKEILKQIDDPALFQILQLEEETHHHREFEIIKNIYEYSRTHEYERAVMFIGSGHRRTLPDQIKKFENEELKLNWLGIVQSFTYSSISRNIIIIR